MTSFMRKQYQRISIMELQASINQLHGDYVPLDLRSEHYEKKLVALKKLNSILKNANRKALIETEIDELLLCSLILVYYFGMRLKSGMPTSRFAKYCTKRHFNQAEETFRNVLYALLPDRTDAVIIITLDVFSTLELWPYENFVVQLLELILYFSGRSVLCFELLLHDINNIIIIDVISARHRMRVFHALLNTKHWVSDDTKLLPLVKRLLDSYSNSINTKYIETNTYSNLRKGFELCLRRIIDRVNNDTLMQIISAMLNWFAVSNVLNYNVHMILEFSNLLEYAVRHYRVKLYNESLTEELINHILKNLIGSKNSSVSLVGCRVLEILLDREKNYEFLLDPKIFFYFSEDAIKKGDCNEDDKQFIQCHRKNLNEYLMIAVKNHCTNVVNLRIMCSVICCVVLEVPCGLTAAIAAYFVMSIQDFALNVGHIPAHCRYWLHAMVVSVMSLICWVHNAPVLYTYVNTIITRRAKEAPHLNPPIMYQYTLRRPHTTWNKPQLFFEDWELRYALWKHFQTKHVRKDKWTQQPHSELTTKH